MRKVKKRCKNILIFLFLIANISLIPFYLPNNSSSDMSFELFNKERNIIPRASLNEGPELPWESNSGIPIFTGPSQSRKPSICSDGNGGAIITWVDDGENIYVQKVNSEGIQQWYSEGILININFSEGRPQLCSDDNGGAIITWQDHRGIIAGDDIYAQRVTSTGNVEWTPNGVLICRALFNDQNNPQICSDGNDGAIIAWQDERSSWGIYAQKINSSGNVQWANNGVLILGSNKSLDISQICSDGKGGAIIAWVDYEANINAQLINSEGISQSGEAISICDESSYYPQICSDQNGGAIIVWNDYRSDPSDIYAQRINSSGSPQWITNGIPICTAIGGQDKPQICSDGNNGAIIVWTDPRGTDVDIYAQRINSTGDVQWTINGTIICNTTGTQQNPKVVSNENGGAFFTWEDVSSADIYAQLFNSTGDIQWTLNGFPICAMVNTQNNPQICSGGKGSAIITWQDSRLENFDIFAQKVKEQTSFIIHSPENKNYKEPISGYFPATYGFENDDDGSHPEGLIIDRESPTVEIIPDLDGHKKVVRLYDTEVGSGMSTRIYTNFSVKEYGTIELWLQQDKINDDGYRCQITGIGNDTNLYGIRMIGGNPAKWSVIDNGTNVDIIGAPIPTANTWYHVRIDFEHTTNNYQGLNENEYFVYINGTRYGPYKFSADLGLEELHLHTYSWGSHYNIYFDAIGFSWDPNYNIGDNINEGLLLDFEANTNLNWMGYSLDDQEIVSILGRIVFPIYNDGHHTIQVFGYDSPMKIYQSKKVEFVVDRNFPEIIIHSPSQNETYGIFAPKYNISINEANLASAWYTMDNGTTNISFIETNGYINQDAWNEIPEDLNQIVLKFYAEDIVGYIGANEVIIYKYIDDSKPKSEEPTVPGYSLPIIVFGSMISGIVVLFKKRKKIFQSEKVPQQFKTKFINSTF